MRDCAKWVIASCAMLAVQPAIAADLNSVPMIERAKLFGNPVKANGRISPDGKWLSWTAPRDGVLNIWVAPTSDPAAAKPLTDEKERPVRTYFWSPDSTQILFIQDQAGDDNFLLCAVLVASGRQ